MTIITLSGILICKSVEPVIRVSMSFIFDSSILLLATGFININDKAYFMIVLVNVFIYFRFDYKLEQLLSISFRETGI